MVTRRSFRGGAPAPAAYPPQANTCYEGATYARGDVITYFGKFDPDAKAQAPPFLQVPGVPRGAGAGGENAQVRLAVDWFVGADGISHRIEYHVGSLRVVPCADHNAMNLEGGRRRRRNRKTRRNLRK